MSFVDELKKVIEQELESRIYDEVGRLQAENSALKALIVVQEKEIEKLKEDLFNFAGQQMSKKVTFRKMAEDAVIFGTIVRKQTLDTKTGIFEELYQDPYTGEWLEVELDEDVKMFLAKELLKTKV